MVLNVRQKQTGKGVIFSFCSESFHTVSHYAALATMITCMQSCTLCASSVDCTEDYSLLCEDR